MQTCLYSLCVSRWNVHVPSGGASTACSSNTPEDPIDSMDAWLPDEVEAWSPPRLSPMPSLLWSEASTVCRQAQGCLRCQLSLLSSCSMPSGIVSSACIPGCTKLGAAPGCTAASLGPAEGRQQVLHPDNQLETCRSSMVGTDCCKSSQTQGSPRSSGSASSGCFSLVPRPWCRRNCACCLCSQRCCCGPAHHLQQYPPCLTLHNWDACPCAPHQLSPARERHRLSAAACWAGAAQIQSTEQQEMALTATFTVHAGHLSCSSTQLYGATSLPSRPHYTTGNLTGQGAAGLGHQVQEPRLTWEKASDPILLTLALPPLPVSGSAKENWPAERMIRPCSESLVPSEEPWDRAREPRRIPLAVLAACKERRHMYKQRSELRPCTMASHATAVLAACKQHPGILSRAAGTLSLHHDHTQGGSACKPCIAQQSLQAPAGRAEQNSLAFGHSTHW